VASITIASGADNVAVYAPLFATAGVDGFATTVVVFAVLLAALLAAGRLIGSRAAVVRAVHHAGDYAVPVVLIALGVFIIAESGLL
jgi:cadmium resistance protein CadD (predicted permease)